MKSQILLALAICCLGVLLFREWVRTDSKPLDNRESNAPNHQNDIGRIVNDELALARIDEQDKRLRDYFGKRDWELEILNETSSLKFAHVVKQCSRYDLVDPAYAFANQLDTDDELFYQNGFVPIGCCGNGDFLLVFAAKESQHFQTGAVYLMSHDYGWEHAVEKPEIVPKITRKLTSDVETFLRLAKDENSELPMDYFDKNDDPYVPEYLKRGKRKLKNRTKQRSNGNS